MEGKRRERLDRGIKVRSEGIYALSSPREIMYLLAPRLVLILGLLIIPPILPGAWPRIMTLAGIFALLAVCFDFLTNYVGLVLLGGAMLTGIGGYIAGILNYYLGLNPALTIPIATIGGATISTLFLLPCLPLRGIYFAIVSLIYPMFFARIIVALDIFGGTDGLTGLTTFPNRWIEIYLIVGVLLIGCFGLRRLVNEDIGLVFRGIKDNDQAVKASGISITLYKAQAVFIASAIGAFAGAYLSHLYGWAGISLFALDFSILPIAATVVGGMGTLAGPLLGAFILSPLSEVLRAFGPVRIVFYALILAIFIAVWSEGLLNYLQRKYNQFERWVKV